MSVKPPRAADTVISVLGTKTTRTVASANVKRLTLTPADAADPTKLARAYQAILDTLTECYRASVLRSDAGATVVHNVTFAAGQTIHIRHELGRAYTDFAITRPRAAAAVDIREVTPTTQFPANIFLSLVSTNAATVNLRVW